MICFVGRIEKTPKKRYDESYKKRSIPPMSLVIGTVSQNQKQLNERIRASRTLVTDVTPGFYSMHAHEYHELYCLLLGHADFLVEGTRYPLAKGDIVLVRKGEAHMINYRDTEPYERILIHFRDEAVSERDSAPSGIRMLLSTPLQGQMNHFRAAAFAEKNWFYYLTRMLTENDPVQQLYLHVLLLEMSEALPLIDKAPSDQTCEPVSKAIAYISRHLSDKLTLEDICGEVFLSRSQLNRLFQKTTGHTIWSYVTLKRMLLAKELLRKGERPSQVFGRAGYTDYSTFYRAYTGFYGISPSEDVGKTAPE